MRYSIHIILSFILFPLAAGASDLAFHAVDNGFFEFDTGALKGKLRADASSQGVVSIVDASSGVELAYGGDNPGIFSLYRVLSTNKRWGEDARARQKLAKPLDDGRAHIYWPPDENNPYEMSAIYGWKAPEALDLEILCKPHQDMKNFEIFLSSYFAKDFQSWIYAKAPRHAPGVPAFLAADGNPLVLGTYLAFPRDLAAAQLFCDGRWELGSNPVQWSLTRYLEAPIGMRKNANTGLTAVMMAKPEDCFALETPYNLNPPDGVAGHNSLYMSFIGKDVAANDTVSVRARLVIGPNISDQAALELYQRFVKGE
ncbi:MAG: hypothetical protein AB1656_10305 [Candidatus Omnitrophota bacterium]